MKRKNRLRKLFFMVKDFGGTYTCYSASWVFRWIWRIKWTKIIGYDIFITNSEKEAKDYLATKKRDYINAQKHLKL